MIAGMPVESSAGMTAWRSTIRERRLTSSVTSASIPSTPAAIGLPDDVAIVRAVLDGDREAFRALVDRESAPVIRACYRILGDMHEAEDAAQETFVTAYRSLAAWRADGPFGAWLARIAVRLAVRQAGRRTALSW